MALDLPEGLRHRRPRGRRAGGWSACRRPDLRSNTRTTWKGTARVTSGHGLLESSRRPEFESKDIRAGIE